MEPWPGEVMKVTFFRDRRVKSYNKTSKQGMETKNDPVLLTVDEISMEKILKQIENSEDKLKKRGNSILIISGATATIDDEDSTVTWTENSDKGGGSVIDNLIQTFINLFLIIGQLSIH